MMWLLMASLAFAGDAIERPDPIEPILGECLKVYPIREGKPLPPAILAQDKSASCSAVVVPLSDYADLLAAEKWGVAVSSQYRIDTAALEADIEWYKKKLEEESKPPPFLERPGTQRWFGRLETLVTVGVVAAGLGAAYQYGSGGFK
tara:strand:+ start:962 stop:1402 length:441 start_codon:yes stop_codon:yes gene_type:complete